MSPLPSVGKGFTLLEVMVASTILSVLLVLLASIIGKVSETWRSSRMRADNYTKGRISLELIQRDLQSAQIGTGLPGFQNAAGEPELAFYSLQPGPIGGGLQSKRPLSKVGYKVVDTGGEDTRGLQRGVSGLSFDEVPPFNHVFPSAIPVIADEYYQMIGPGVLRMNLRFLSGNSQAISRSFVWRPDVAASSSACITVCLLVLDDETLRVVDYPGVLQKFDAAVSGISENELPASRWSQVCSSESTFAGLPGERKLRQALRVYERTIRLPIP